MQKKNEQSGVWYFYSAYDLIITNASATKIENPNPNNFILRGAEDSEIPGIGLRIMVEPVRTVF